LGSPRHDRAVTTHSEALLRLVEGTARATSEAFFRALVAGTLERLLAYPRARQRGRDRGARAARPTALLQPATVAPAKAPTRSHDGAILEDLQRPHIAKALEQTR
jgi:hypothetical protein